jgi:hypothetical protein
MGYVPERQVDARGRIVFTVYWECLSSMNVDYSVFVSVKGRDLQEVGKLDAYPHRGLLATSACPQGAVFADEYRIPIAPSAQRPALLRAEIGLNDWRVGRRASIKDGAGNPIEHVFIDVAGLPSSITPPAPEIQTHFEFGGMIRLLGYTLTEHDGAIDLDLQWLALTQPPLDYTLFVHVLDDAGAQIEAHDAPPLAGDYPTSYWQLGEVVLDQRTLMLPQGEIRLAIGWYRPPDGPRLSVIDSRGVRLPDDRIVISLD